MQTATKLIPIGNSKGIRISKSLLLKYKLEDQIIIEEVEGGLFIHAKGNKILSWKNTYKAISDENEDWSDWQGFEDNEF